MTDYLIVKQEDWFWLSAGCTTHAMIVGGEDGKKIHEAVDTVLLRNDPGNVTTRDKLALLSTGPLEIIHASLEYQGASKHLIDLCASILAEREQRNEENILRDCR